MTVAGAITNRALVVARDQPDPVASNNSAAAIVNGAANADVGVNTAVDKPAPLVGEHRDVHGDGGERGPEPRHRCGRHRCAARGAHARVGDAVAGHVRRAHLDRRHPERDRATPATLTIVATVTAPGALVNTATITQQTEVDPNAANNSASVTLNAAESANLTVTKALTRSSPHVGELLTFNVIVANQGPSPATGVAVTEVLSAGLAFELAAPSQGSYDSATGLWTVGSIANAGSAGLTITARVTQAGTVTNTASVTASDQPDPDLTDNTATVTLTTETIADLAITKTLTGSAVPGRATTYAIVVTNTGPSPVTAASVSDLFPVALVAPAWTCTADPGSSCAAASGTGNLATTVTLEAGDRATFTVTGLIAANATGLLVNTATVTAPAGAVDPDTDQQHRDQFGDADALRRSPHRQGRPPQRRGRDECRLHDHRHECGTIGCHRRHARRPDAPRPDVRRRTPATARPPSRAISARCLAQPPAPSRRPLRFPPVIRRPIRSPTRQRCRV